MKRGFARTGCWSKACQQRRRYDTMDDVKTPFAAGKLQDKVYLIESFDQREVRSQDENRRLLPANC